MNTDEIRTYSRLMADCFIDDPGIKVQLEGITDKLQFLELQCRCQIEAFSRLGGISVLDNGGGMAIGYFSHEESLATQYLQECSSGMMEHISAEDLAKMSQNAVKVLQIARPDWFQRFVKENEVYILQAIMVHPSQRGTGAFRKLITPVIEKAEQRKTPIVLQTLVYEHTEKYQHFGFRLVETVKSDQMDLSCYNMIKFN